MIPITARTASQGASLQGCLREEGQVEAQKTVGAHFQQDAARITEPAVGASTWASGSQVCNGNIGTLMANANPKATNSHTCAPAKLCRVRASSVREKVSAVEPDKEDRQQHQDRTSQGEQEELKGRVDPPLATPDTDQEVHRHQGEFPENVEKNQVQRQKDTHHAISSSRKNSMKPLTRSA